jgi:alcohol dehydrogenase
VDPDLLESCPRPLIAADGMDALTQLLEAYVSPRANPFTDALAESGMVAVRDGLLRGYEGRGDSSASRSRMAYAALLSGITLAQAGLGAVHGLSAPLGGFFPIPHGVVCGTLVADTTRVNVAALRARAPEDVALAKYARAWMRLADREGPPPPDAPERLGSLLEDWAKRLDLPRLRDYGMGEEDVTRVVAGSRGGSMKTNPIVLEDEEIAAIVRAKL